MKVMKHCGNHSKSHEIIATANVKEKKTLIDFQEN